MIPLTPAYNPFAQVRFLLSCARLDQLPTDGWPEVAFVGRSNAGKSSALNAVCQKKALARVSKTPGRTQLINVFEVADARLIDLPGYGFAAVPDSVRRDWGKLIGGYLETRDQIRLLVLLMDVRHPMTDLDVQMLDWAADAGRPVHILLTKADKLSRSAGFAALKGVKDALAARKGEVSVQLFSAHAPLGLDDARDVVHAALQGGKIS